MTKHRAGWAAQLCAAGIALAPTSGRAAHDGCLVAIEGRWVNAADPRAMAEARLPAFERLSRAIPTLSPREQQWLDNERSSGDRDRRSRAYESREFSLIIVKGDAESLLRILRRLAAARDHRQHVRDWLLLVHRLVDPIPAPYLAWLMAVGVVGRDAHPAGRALEGGTSVDGLRDQIQQSRTSIAQDILACTLPTVTGVASL